MSNGTTFATLALPAELMADDLIGVHDLMAARIDAVVRPGGKKPGDGDPPLPEGLLPRDSLPDQIDRPWQRFHAATTELSRFRGARAGAQAEEAYAATDETEQTAANADADDRWRAIERWNSASALLADDGAGPSPAEARWLYAQTFPPPDGLRFITWRPRAQWTQMVQRMQVLEGERAQAVIHGFGGARFYAQLLAAHARYGKAYGFTIAVPDPVGGPTDGRPQWLAARDALRALVHKVEAYADPDIEGSEALVAFLLGPYVAMVTDMEKSRRARAKKPEPAPAPPAKPTP